MLCVFVGVEFTVSAFLAVEAGEVVAAVVVVLEDAAGLVFFASSDALAVEAEAGTVDEPVALGSESDGVLVCLAAVFFVSAPVLVLAVVFAFGARVFFAGVAFTSAVSFLEAAEAFAGVFFIVADALVLALVAVSLGAAALVFFTVSFNACSFFGLVVETWRAPWQRGATIKVPMGVTAGLALTQLLPHRDSIWVLRPSRDIL